MTNSLAYDAADRLTSESYTNGSTTLYSVAYTLDAAGQRLSETDPSGTTTYSYDDLYRLTKVVYPDGRTVTYSYDPTGNRTQMVDSSAASPATATTLPTSC